MRGRQLLGSQRLRYAVSTLNYFPHKVSSFPLSLDFLSFRGRNVLRGEDFVTPCPERVYSTCNCRGVYEHQVSHCGILEMKLGNDNLWNPDCCNKNKGKIVIDQMRHEGHNQRR